MNIPEQSIQQLRPTILYCLDHGLLPTAEFTAERLIAQNPNNLDSVHLYALTLYKKDRFKAAYNISSPHCAEHVGCSYIFAQTCLKLNQETNGITALLKTLPLWSNMVSDSNDRYQPDNISCYMLLAKLYSVVGDVKRASMHYSQVLKLNPYIFEAFEELCRMGVKIKVNSIYRVNPTSNNLFRTNGALEDPLDENNSIRKPSGSVFGFNEIPRDKKEFKNSLFKTPNSKTKAGILPSSPEMLQGPALSGISITPRTKQHQQQQQQQILEAPSRRTSRNSSLDSFKHPSDSISRKKVRGANSITSRLLGHPFGSNMNVSGSNNSSTNTSNASNMLGQQKEGLGVKRVINLTFSNNNNNNSNNNTNNINNANTNNNNVNSKNNNNPNNNNNDNDNNNNIINTNNNTAGRNEKDILKNLNDEYLIFIYSKIAKGYKALTNYDCFKAIRIFDSLPENERNTPWVLAKLGRLHFEIVNYEEAENYFIKLRRIDRTRIEDMEYYSTLLWHLHKEIELSFLSHELYEVNKDAPETWIAIGNLFSFKRESDEAIKCFQKATNLDKDCVYAYTLQGHEYLASDAFENSMECFRHAILLDRRHYNAFYGIGMVYLKLGDFRKAEFHFRKAVEINPVNVILICCVGMVLEKLGKRELALRQYVFASKLQSLSMLALFKKAQVLFSLKQYDEALKDFEKLQDLAPDEASVHFLLGKLYKYYGRKNEAIKQFTIALNLDPKGSHLIKEALENLDDGNMND